MDVGIGSAHFFLLSHVLEGQLPLLFVEVSVLFSQIIGIILCTQWLYFQLGIGVQNEQARGSGCPLFHAVLSFPFLCE